MIYFYLGDRGKEEERKRGRGRDRGNTERQKEKERDKERRKGEIHCNNDFKYNTESSLVYFMKQ